MLVLLRQERFPHVVVHAVDAMSKRDGEDYLAFVRRSIENPLAQPVKRADLSDNLAQMRQMRGGDTKLAEGLRILNENLSRHLILKPRHDDRNLVESPPFVIATAQSLKTG